MSSISSKHIVIGLITVFVLIFLFLQGNRDNSYDYSGAQSQSPLQSQSPNHSFESENTNPYSLIGSNNPTNLQRHEILQTKVKGYREFTYWGEQTPTYEKVREMNNDEFDRFIEKVELNDADVYWGAQY